MGWLFGWNTRRELADHLIGGKDIKTIKHCFKGNNLWAVQEGVKQDGTVVRFIALYLLRGRTGSRDGWGYKGMDESAGPSAVNCPLSYLDMTPVGPGYAAEWRERVHAYHAKRARKFSPGTRIRLGDAEYEITGRPYRNHDYSAKDIFGDTWRIPNRRMPDAEVLV
jgi:hypothetical protein